MREVHIDELTPPKYEGQAHRHDAFVYVYVAQGTIEMQVAGKAAAGAPVALPVTPAGG